MKINKILAVVAGAVLCFTSCVNDLGDPDNNPLNDWDKTANTAYGNSEEGYVQGLAKLYNSIATHALYDISGVDGGATSTIRAFWVCQEVTTDACKVGWGNDAWVRAMNTNTWTDADNEAVYGVFFRSLQGIAWVNEYLRQTASGKLSERGVDATLAAKIEGFRAEARFIRALYYWMAMDVFGAVPFATEDSEVGTTAPAQAPATEIYNYVVSELEALAADGSAMPEAQSEYPRADKGSCLGLLARVYLNAETYVGVPAYDKVITTCERIFGMGYSLSPVYSDLFRGDNGENIAARNEFLFAVEYDSLHQQSYGGTSFLTLAAVAAEDVTDSCRPNGVNGGWGGIRCTEFFVDRYFNVNVESAQINAGGYDNGAYTLDAGCNDDRSKLFFLGLGKREGTEITNEEQMYMFQFGWQCLKFNNIPSNMTEEDFRKSAASEAFADIDFPVVRLGDVYLMYAEACVREGQASKAQPYVDLLLARSNAAGHTLASSWTNEERDWFVAERVRELSWEGTRRMDLIRYGLFCSNDYLWPFKGGTSYAGQAFPEYMKLFAIPASQIVANPALKNPEGY